MEACFCTSMGIDPQQGEGADIQAYDLGISWLLKVLQKRGRVYWPR